ncbi:hypothetical protein K457DRAFT_835073 [Linnemannia elongata AG-77]|uniref:Uncharacterized protein n=1 Tax=Linnemannia elongata AG-77 TaxID=1314771 RepID=A0A197JIZ7_9FUNG|nr:hypothetical protein K457DRAFT_835073 [Linnemannia elongata AG-77]
MIPLTRSRLNRYNSGAIDLSDSYQQNGNSSSSSNGSGSSSNMTVRATAWNAPSTSGNAVQSHQPQSLRITSSSSPLDKPPQSQVQNYHNHHHRHTTSFRETSRKRKISHEEMEVVVEEQQYQPRKRDSHTLTGSGQMRESIDGHMDDSYVNRPSTQSKFTPQTAPSTKPTRQYDPASWPQSTSTPSGPPTLLSIELSSRPSSAKSPPPSSLLSSKDYASQDESGDHQSENTSSGDDDEEDEDEESDEDGGSDKDKKPKKDEEQHRDEELDKDRGLDENGQSDEDQMRSAPLQVQSGRSADGRITNATLIEYRKYQVHFKEWCIRKRHTDGDNVTKDKLLAYAKELTAREAYEDEANPHLSIRPIFGNYGVNRHGRISPISMRKRLNAIQFLHREQCQQKGLVSNLGQEVKRAVGALLQKYRELPEEIFAPKASPAKKKSNIGRYSSIKSKVPATRSEKGSGTALSSTRKSRVTHSLSSAATAAGAVSRRGTKASRPKGASATNAKPTTSKSAPDISSNPASSPTSKPASAINSNPTSAPISRPTPTSTSAPTNSAFIPRPAPAHTLRTTPAFVSASPASATISKLTTSSTASKPTSASAPISTSTSIPTSSSGCKTVAVFSGSGSTTTLPSALHSDSAALLTPPAPSSALKSGSNSNPTNWASNLTLNVASNSAGNSKHTLASAPSHNVSAPMSTPASTPTSAPVSAPASSPLTSKSTLTQINYQGTKAGQVPVANAKPDSASGVAVDTRDMSVPAADNAPPYVAPNAKTLLRHRAHQVLWNVALGSINFLGMVRSQEMRGWRPCHQ